MPDPNTLAPPELSSAPARAELRGRHQASTIQGYALAMDFCVATFEGLVINRDIWDEQAQRVLCAFVGKTIAMLRTGELSVPA